MPELRIHARLFGSVSAAAQPARQRVFLLSPANCGGERAQLLLSSRAQFPLVRQLRSAEGTPLGEVYTFLSGLYFRGKLTYARAFARDRDGVHIITANAGLVHPDTRVRLGDVRAAARVDIALTNPRYRRPLVRSAERLAAQVASDVDVVLLGSVASDKYVGILGDVFGTRLVFPPDFVGRGDMSRGGLLLRCVARGHELPYVPLVGAVRHGPRPPRLEPLRGRPVPS